MSFFLFYHMWAGSHYKVRILRVSEYEMETIEGATGSEGETQEERAKTEVERHEQNNEEAEMLKNCQHTHTHMRAHPRVRALLRVWLGTWGCVNPARPVCTLP